MTNSYCRICFIVNCRRVFSLAFSHRIPIYILLSGSRYEYCRPSATIESPVVLHQSWMKISFARSDFSSSLGKIFVKIKWSFPKQAAEYNHSQQWCFFVYSRLQIYLVCETSRCFDELHLLERHMCVVPALFTHKRDTAITFPLSYVRKEDYVYPLWYISKLHNIKKKIKIHAFGLILNVVFH